MKHHFEMSSLYLNGALDKCTKVNFILLSEASSRCRGAVSLIYGQDPASALNAASAARYSTNIDIITFTVISITIYLIDLCLIS